MKNVSLKFAAVDRTTFGDSNSSCDDAATATRTRTRTCTQTCALASYNSSSQRPGDVTLFGSHQRPNTTTTVLAVRVICDWARDFVEPRSCSCRREWRRGSACGACRAPDPTARSASPASAHAAAQQTHNTTLHVKIQIFFSSCLRKIIHFVLNIRRYCTNILKEKCTSACFNCFKIDVVSAGTRLDERAVRLAELTSTSVPSAWLSLMSMMSGSGIMEQSANTQPTPIAQPG